MRETKFKQVLRWSEFGKILFIGESLFMIGITYVPLVQMALEGRLQLWMEHHDIFLYPFSYLWSTNDVVLTIAFIFLPLFLAWLTQWKLLKPLNEEKVPSQKCFHILLMIGLSFLIFIYGYFIIVMPWLNGWRRFFFGPSELLSNILGANLFFSSLIVGTLCVAVARHKSEKLAWGFSNMGITRFKFDDILRWSEYGMLCFILSILSASAVLISQNLQNHTFLNFSFYFRNITLWTLFFWTLYLLALLTYEKLVKSLKKS